MHRDLHDFVAHCTDLLASIGVVRSKRMFGGHGFYVDELFVGLILGERLYLKVDAQTRAAFESAGCEPFVYSGANRTVTLGYFSAPDGAIESAPSMQPWARLAIDAALRARAAKPAAASRKPVATETAPKATARSARAASPRKRVRTGEG